MLGFIGGTGPEGRGLATRFAISGECVSIGSRDQAKAELAVDEVSQIISSSLITGGLNKDVANEADLIFVTTPYAGHKDILTSLENELTGKIVVDVVAPLAFVKGRATAIRVEEGSAAMQAKKVLPNSIVVSAFQSISAEDLLVPDKIIDSDVIVCSDDYDAKVLVMELAGKIEKIRAVDGGHLENSRYVEDFTALLLNINRIYKAHSTVKISGIF